MANTAVRCLVQITTASGQERVTSADCTCVMRSTRRSAARVSIRIQTGVKLQDDAIASIKTKGLIGERYVRISPGGSDKIIEPNGRIREVEPPVDIEELLSKYIFGKV